MCNVNDPRILNAYIAITEDEPTDWLLMGYKDTRDVISLYACGEHGLSEFRDHITNEILFGFVRIEEKFILITYIPDSISGVRRARALVHSRAVAGVLELSHAQIIASSLSDLSDNNVRTRLKLEPGTRPRSRTSFIQQQRRRRSGSSYYSPSPSPVTFITDDEDDRMSATPTPSTPTSSVHSEHHFPTILESNFLVEEPKRLQDTTETMLQMQLAKKKELEEARFKLFHKEQKPNIAKRIEEEQKRLKQQQHQQKEIPKWQLELQQRKMKKQETMLTERPKSIRIDTANLNRQQSLPVNLKSVQPAMKEAIKEPVKEYHLKSVSPVEQIKQQSNIEPTIQHNLHHVQPVIKEAVKEPVKRYSLKSVPVEKPKPSGNDPIGQHHLKSEPVKEQPTIKQEPVTPVLQQTAKNQVIQEEQKPTEAQVEALKVEEKVLTPLMTGFVSVQVNQSPFWKRRYFILTAQTLSFYKDETTKKCLDDINLKSTKRVSLIDEDEEVFVPHSFMIETDELYQVLADDKKQYKQLYTTIKQSI